MLIMDIIDTIRSGGYGESSDNIIECDYETVIDIIEYLIKYYEDKDFHFHYLHSLCIQ